MQYDFDRLVDRRHTHSSKWDLSHAMFGEKDLLNMWVADMDFPCPQPVVEALRRRVEHPFYGYTFAPDSLYDAIIEWVGKRYGWSIKKEWIVFNPGVIEGLYSAIKALAKPGDEIVVQPPVYYPFYQAIKQAGCQLVYNPLRLEGTRYTMDLEGLEGKFRPATTFPTHYPRVKALVLCSPHNPVARVWSRGELEELGRVCLANRCAIIADEIHCDLTVGEARHTVMASVSKELEQHTITLMSASKTFNLAGLHTSYAIIPQAQWRDQFRQARVGHGSVNLFGLVAMEAAYRHGDDYLRQLLDYLKGNVGLFTGYIRENIPAIHVVPPEGTYLAWVDMRRLGLDNLQLQRLIRQKARLAVNDGYAFGPGGDGFQRFNLACPRSVVREALGRLEAALPGR
ncbi:MAG TPA: cystathionine beta-lyase [Clostridiales bacterium UBA8153]|nr:cystathionine beta-lyase [Clostridiales bacterium UBA8153]